MTEDLQLDLLKKIFSNTEFTKILGKNNSDVLGDISQKLDEVKYTSESVQETQETETGTTVENKLLGDRLASFTTGKGLSIGSIAGFAAKKVLPESITTKIGEGSSFIDKMSIGSLATGAVNQLGKLAGYGKEIPKEIPKEDVYDPTKKTTAEEYAKLFAGGPVPKFAEGSGTINKPTVGVFGEAGPEEVVNDSMFQNQGIQLDIMNQNIEEVNKNVNAIKYQMGLDQEPENDLEKTGKKKKKKKTSFLSKALAIGAIVGVWFQKEYPEVAQGLKFVMNIGKYFKTKIITWGKTLWKTIKTGIEGIPIIGKIFSGMGDVLTKGAPKAAKVAGDGLMKIAGKLLKPLLKFIPGVGLGLSIGQAWDYFQEGENNKALIALASGALSLAPGIGPALSIGLDSLLLGDDLTSEDNTTKIETKNNKKGSLIGFADAIGYDSIGSSLINKIEVPSGGNTDIALQMLGLKSKEATTKTTAEKNPLPTEETSSPINALKGKTVQAAETSASTETARAEGSTLGQGQTIVVDNSRNSTAPKQNQAQPRLKGVPSTMEHSYANRRYELATLGR